MSRFKKTTRVIHKWLGLTSGLIVFIVSITGCIFCFHDEIKDITRDYRFVPVESRPYIEPSVLQNNTTALYPGSSNNMVIYSGTGRPAIVYSIDKEIPYYVYFNPYSGDFMHRENLREDFFIIVEYIHLYLLLPPEIGKHIIGGATIIFVFLLITGIIQWWPKKRKHLKDRLKIKWDAKWRRVNYDWHNVTGLYISLIALILALTGLTFTYEWMGDAFYLAGNAGTIYPDELEDPAIDTTITAKGNVPAIDQAFAKTIELAPTTGMYFITDKGEAAAIETGSYPDALEFDHQSNFYFHPATGELIKKHYYNDKSTGLQLKEMNYGLHTGQYFGLTGKIIAFVASLFAAALPVTGFIIWWGRRNKKDKKASKKEKVKKAA